MESNTKSEASKSKKVLAALKTFLSVNFIITLIAMIFSRAVSSGYTTAMSLWGGTHLGLSATELGMAASASFIFALCMRSVSGKFSDSSIPLKLQVLIGALLAGVSTLFMGFTTTAITFALARVIYSGLRMPLGTTTLTIGTFSVDRRLMGTANALMTFIPNLFSTAIVLLASNIFNATADTAPMTIWIVLAVMYVGNAIPYLFLNLKDPRLIERKEAAERTKRERAARGKKKTGINDWIYLPVLPLALMQFFVAFVTFAVEIVAIIIGVERGIDVIVFWLLGSNLFRTIGSLMGGVLADIFNKAKYTVPPCMLLAGCAVLILIFSSNTALITVAGAMYGFARTAITPVMRKVMIGMSPDDKRGAVLSTSSMMVDLSGAIGSGLAGILCDAIGATPTLWVTACLPLAGLVVFAINYHRIADAEAKLAANREEDHKRSEHAARG